MKPVLLWMLLSTFSGPIFAAPPSQEDTAEVVAQNAEKMADSAAVAAGKDEGVEHTVFNDIKVPQMKDIEGEKFNETIKDGYWYVIKKRDLEIRNEGLTELQVRRTFFTILWTLPGFCADMADSLRILLHFFPYRVSDKIVFFRYFKFT